MIASIFDLGLVILLSFFAQVFAKQPNILVVVVDDLGYQDVGFRGSHIKTPNIDKLAQEGVILENHYVMEVCTPSRGSLLTGRYAIRTGLWKGLLKPNEEFGLDLNETLLPEMLKRNGYSTHGVGKWHVGMYTWHHTPAMRGFDTFFGLFTGEQDYFTHKKAGRLDLRNSYINGDGELIDELRSDLNGQYNTGLFSDAAVKVIQTHDTSKPLFLYLAYTAPHIPLEAPKEDVEKFAQHISGKRKTYAAMVSAMDQGVGEVVDAMEKKGLLDNNILVFTSDNGAYFKSKGSNFPLRGGKSSFFEGGVRGVSFVNSPLLQKTGYTNTNLHHVSDWYATFQMLAGDQPDQHKKAQLPLDGVNIWPSISENEPCREEVLLGFRDPVLRLDPRGNWGRRRAEFYKDRNLTSDFLLTGGGSKLAQDYFVIRWKKWKLLSGTSVEIQGWTSENGTDQFKKFSDNKGRMFETSLAVGNFLFDLSSDLREETNVANLHPNIVRHLLDKKEGYRNRMKPIKESRYSGGIAAHGGLKPWIEL